MLVCELEELPKDGRKLQHAIHEFWSARKKHNLLVFACFNMAFWVAYTWLFWLPGQAPPAPALADAAPVVVVEQPTATPAPGAELGALPTATPAPAPAPPAPAAPPAGDQVAAPVPAYPAPPAPAPAPPASDQAAPVVAVAEEGAAPAGDQAAAPAGPHRVYLALIVRGENDE
jgi:type IV secretory pathway VirB10-like protein